MLWLGIDTSDKNLFVCLYRDNECLALTCYEAWQRQSEYLVEDVEKVFASAKVKKTDLQAVIAAKGPGSYTGVRIGLTVAKTLSFALKLPLFLVSSLEILQQYPKPSICLSNARSKRSYFGVYEGGKVLVEDCIKTNDEVRAYIAEHPEYVLCGDLAYLGYDSSAYLPAENFYRCLDDAHRCNEPLSASPVYLKDDYGTTNMKTIVRKSIPSDISRILEIEEACFVPPYDEKTLLYELTGNPFSHVYSALVDGEVVGYIDFMITFNSATINRIAVKEEFRRKGVGNLLLGQVIKDCEAEKDEEVEYLTLEVRASNEKAIRFYKKHKFQDVTVKKGYYDDGEDAIYMTRCLIHG